MIEVTTQLYEELKVKAGVWKHVKKFKGQAFFAGYESTKAGKRIVKFKNVATGKEMSPVYSSIEVAKKAGWVKIVT